MHCIFFFFLRFLLIVRPTVLFFERFRNRVPRVFRRARRVWIAKAQNPRRLRYLILRTSNDLATQIVCEIVRASMVADTRNETECSFCNRVSWNPNRTFPFPNNGPWASSSGTLAILAKSRRFRRVAKVVPVYQS